MKTQKFTIDPKNPDETALKTAADILAQGGLVAFPTETVYGLGANGLNPQAVQGIFTAKGRPNDNPLILHIADHKQLTSIVRTVTASARALIDAYWPGPMTLILPRRDVVPDAVTAGLDTVAVRFPDHPVASRFLALTGLPVAAPSANRSGRPSPTNAAAVLEDLDGRIDAVIDAGPCGIGLESTIVDCTTSVPTVLRPGGITVEMLEEVLGAVEVSSGLVTGSTVPRAPGMKYRHYAPVAPMVLVEGEHEALVGKLRELISAAQKEGKKAAALVSEETYAEFTPDAVTRVYGSWQHPETVAARLFSCLRSFDAVPVDIIYAEGIPEDHIGFAVMNRLRKAAGYQIIRV